MGISLPDAALGVAVAGDFAYVAADEDGGGQIVDVSDPYTPTVATYVGIPGQAVDVTLDGDYVY